MRLTHLTIIAALAACNSDMPDDQPADMGSTATTDFAIADVSSSADDGAVSDVMTVAPDADDADVSTGMSVADADDAGSDVGGDLGDMPSCTDAYEPNDVVADAATVSAPTTISATNCGFDDDDVYAIDLTAGQTITLTHSFSNGQGNLDMNLHAPSQAGDVSKNGSAVEITFAFDDVETITHTAEETGTYYVLSFNNNDSENSYTLEFDVQ